MRSLGNTGRVIALGLFGGFVVGTIGSAGTNIAMPDPTVSALGHTVTGTDTNRAGTAHPESAGDVVLDSTTNAASDIESLVAEATVELASTTCDGTNRGLGVLVNGRIITARHVVEGATAIEAHREGQPLNVITTLVSTTHDVAVLSLVSVEDSDAYLRSVPAELGESLIVARGHRSNLEPEPTAVRETRRGSGRNDPPISLALVTNSLPGDSGGGVFDQAGGLVGIVYAQAHADSAALVVPSAAINDAFGTLGEQLPDHC